MKLWKLRIYNGWNTFYSGLNYKQGMGFDLDYKSFEIYWRGVLKLRIITGIRIDHQGMWLDSLKEKLKD